MTAADSLTRYAECASTAFSLLAADSPWPDLSAYRDDGMQYVYNEKATQWDLALGTYHFQGQLDWNSSALSKELSSAALSPVGDDGHLGFGIVFGAHTDNGVQQQQTDETQPTSIIDVGDVVYVEGTSLESINIGTVSQIQAYKNYFVVGIKSSNPSITEPFTLSSGTAGAAVYFRRVVPGLDHGPVGTCPLPAGPTTLAYALHTNSITAGWVAGAWAEHALSDFAAGVRTVSTLPDASLLGRTHGRLKYSAAAVGFSTFYLHIGSIKRNGLSKVQSYGPIVRVTDTRTSNEKIAESSVVASVNFVEKYIKVVWDGSKLGNPVHGGSWEYHAHEPDLEYYLGLETLAGMELLPLTPIIPFVQQPGCTTPNFCWSVPFAVEDGSDKCFQNGGLASMPNACATHALQHVPSFKAVVRVCSKSFTGICKTYQSVESIGGIPRAPPSKGTVIELDVETVLPQPSSSHLPCVADSSSLINRICEHRQDIDYQISTSDLRAKWSNFDVADDVGEVTYAVVLKDSTGVSISTAEVKTLTEHTFTGLSLEHPKHYVVEVTATNLVGSTGPVTSDGITIITLDQHALSVRNGLGLSETKVHTLDNRAVVLLTSRSSDANLLLAEANDASKYVIGGLHTGERYTAVIELSGSSHRDTPGGLENVKLRIGLTEVVVGWTKKESLSNRNVFLPAVEFYARSNSDSLVLTFEKMEDGSAEQAVAVKVTKLDIFSGVSDLKYVSTGHTVAAHWDDAIKAQAVAGPYHYEWRIANDVAETTQPYIPVGSRWAGNDPSFVTEPGIYHTDVRVCGPVGCENATSSAKFYVWPSDQTPEPSSAPKAEYSQPPTHDGSTTFAFEWAPFIFDVQPELASKEMTPLVYEWRLHVSTSTGDGLLIPWQYVPTTDRISTVKVHQTFAAIDLSLHETGAVHNLYLTVRASSVNGRVGSTTVIVQPTTTISAAHAITVLDAAPSNFEGGALLEGVVPIDIDYSSSEDLIAATWYGLWQNYQPDYVLWSIVTMNRAFDVECTPDTAGQIVSCGQVIGKTYAAIAKIKLQLNERYFVCLKAGPTTTVATDGTTTVDTNDDLQPSCTNGVVIDRLPPRQGVVQVHRPADSGNPIVLPAYQHSRTTLKVSWHGFEDVEVTSGSGLLHASGIAAYYVAVGTSPGTADIVDGTSKLYSRLDTYAEFGDLSLPDGTTVYASVTACDHVKLCTTSVSHAVTIDGSPPVAGFVTVKRVAREKTSVTVVEVCWTPFTDAHSGIATYTVGIGTEPKYSDLDGGSFDVSTEADRCQTRTLNYGPNEQHFYATVMAMNHANLVTFASSVVMLAPADSAVTGHVWDGDGAYDIDFQQETNSLAGQWANFDNRVVEYWWAIGTAPDTADVRWWQSTGRLLQGRQDDVNLHDGHTYYILVRGCRGHETMFAEDVDSAHITETCAEIASDGVLVDGTPPAGGIVSDGLGVFDARYQHDTSTISATWRDFDDPDSQLKEYQWCWYLDDASHRCDKDSTSFVSVGMLTQASEISVAPTSLLVEGTKITVVVRAYNRALLFSEAISDGVIINTSPPTASERPKWNPLLKFATTHSTLARPADIEFQSAGTMLSASWKFAHTQTHSLEYHYTVSTSDDSSDVYDGSTLRQSFTQTVERAGAGGGQPIDGFTLHNLPLEDGERYYLSVTACDESGLCSAPARPISDGILIDASPPTTGSLLNGLTINRNQRKLLLAWHGFQDPHSGVADYYILVGTSSAGRDLYDGSESPISHVTNCVKDAENQCAAQSGNQHAGYLHGDKDPFTPGQSGDFTNDYEEEYLEGTGLFATKSTWEEPWAKYVAKTTSDEIKDIITLDDTKPIPAAGVRFFITIQARNGVGLFSEPVHTEVEVNAHLPDVALDIVHHSCSKHDDCATASGSNGILCACGAVANECETHEVDTGNTTDAGGKCHLHDTCHDDHSAVCEGNKVSAETSTSKVPACKVFDGSESGVDIDYQAETRVYAANWQCDLPAADVEPITRLQYAITERNHEGQQSANVGIGGSKESSAHLQVSDPNDPDYDSHLIHKESLLGNEMRFWADSGASTDVSTGKGGGVFATMCTQELCPHSSDSMDKAPRMGDLSNMPSNSGSEFGYEFHLRVWSASGFRDFVSDGVDITSKRPGVLRKRSAVRETFANTLSQAHGDHDSATGDAENAGKITIGVDWQNVFKPSSGYALTPIANVKIGVGTTPQGTNVHDLEEICSESAFQMCSGATSAPVEVALAWPGARYYTTVRAQNAAGLTAWAVSDGFVADDTAPTLGVVKVGGVTNAAEVGQDDVVYQSSTVLNTETRITAQWSGFHDRESQIAGYKWAIATTKTGFGTPPNPTMMPMGWRSVFGTGGTSPFLDKQWLTSGLNTFYVGVKAQNTAGLWSEVVISDAIGIDTTGPMLIKPCASGSSSAHAVACTLMHGAKVYTATSNGKDSRYPSPIELASEATEMECALNSLKKGAKYSLSLFAGINAELVGTAQLGTIAVVEEGAENVVLLHQMFKVSKKHSHTEGWSEVHLFFTPKKAGNYKLVVGGSINVAGGGSVLVDQTTVTQQECSSTAIASSNGKVTDGIEVTVHGTQVVESRWHAADPESGIAHSMWAVGTQSGGTQLRDFEHVAGSSAAAYGALARPLPPGASLYVTVIVTNRGGGSSTFYSEPVTVDRTSPFGVVNHVGVTNGDSAVVHLQAGQLQPIYPTLTI